MLCCLKQQRLSVAERGLPNSVTISDRFHACTIHTRNLDYEAAICFLTPRMQRCDLTGIRLAITCGRYVDGQDEFVVNLSTIAPSFFTSFIWTDPVVAEWCSIRQTNNLADQDELGSKRNRVTRCECSIVCVAINYHFRRCY